MAQNPIITFEMENGDIMKAELYPQVAPNTVNNFISLVNKGFYDGLIFHRVINGFMIQGGDPEGTGMGGPGYGIKGEFAQNGFANDLKHTAGVLSMARSMMPNSAGSQFFIMHKAAPHLDGEYAAFGKVIEGMDVVDNVEDFFKIVFNAADVIQLLWRFEGFGEEVRVPAGPGDGAALLVASNKQGDSGRILVALDFLDELLPCQPAVAVLVVPAKQQIAS